jgi:hypothetical protein
MFSAIYEYLIHLVLFVGAVLLLLGFLTSILPVIDRYKLPLQLSGILIFSIGVWFESALNSDLRWKMRVAEVEAELADARVESGKVTVETVTKYVKDTQVITERVETIAGYIEREVVRYDNVCPIPDTVIISHNASALNNTELLNVVPKDKPVTTQQHNEVAKPRLILAPKQ